MIKIFAHRGYILNDIKENSIESLENAYNNQFYGVEFDVFFVKNQLFLSHDKPKSLQNLPKFANYLKYGDNFKYWIDFKNITTQNCQEILKIVEKDLKNAKISLKNVYFAPFIRDFAQALPIYQEIRNIFGQDAQIMALCVEIPGNNPDKYLQDLRKNNIGHLSILHKNIDQNFVELAKNIEIFAWTVNDQKRLGQLENLGIKYCTSDVITPKSAKK